MKASTFLARRDTKPQETPKRPSPTVHTNRQPPKGSAVWRKPKNNDGLFVSHFVRDPSNRWDDPANERRGREATPRGQARPQAASNHTGQSEANFPSRACRRAACNQLTHW